MRISIKVCGLRHPLDARKAISLGADFAGVIGYPGSPRYLKFGEEERVLAEIPEGRRVWVSVEPAAEEVKEAFSRGFDFAQIHFDPAGHYDPHLLSERFDRERLWLAPRLSHPRLFAKEWIGLVKVFLIDGFSRDRMGGTGRRVDGRSFADLAAGFPQSQFVLAGGIAPENVVEALSLSGANRIDVNSGIETAPGEKDHQRMEELFSAVGSRIGGD